jgi:hypothetical protein
MNAGVRCGVFLKWLKTVQVAQAVKERGSFGNQNTATRPRTPKWKSHG